MATIENLNSVDMHVHHQRLPKAMPKAPARARRCCRPRLGLTARTGIRTRKKCTCTLERDARRTHLCIPPCGACPQRSKCLSTAYRCRPIPCSPGTRTGSARSESWAGRSRSRCSILSRCLCGRHRLRTRCCCMAHTQCRRGIRWPCMRKRKRSPRVRTAHARARARSRRWWRKSGRWR